MTDKTLNKQDVLTIRQLFHDRFNGKISHDDLMAKLDRINNKQQSLLEKEVSDAK
jgi:hypothetical protein